MPFGTNGLKRCVGRVGRTAGSGRLVCSLFTQRFHLTLLRLDVGMTVREAARTHGGKLRLRLSQRVTGTATIGHHDAARRAGKLPVDGGKRALRSSDIGIHPSHFGAHALQTPRDRCRAAHQIGVLRLERQTALLRRFQFGLAIVQLLVEECDRARNFTAIAGYVRFPKNVDEALNHVLGERGIFGIAQVRFANGGGNFEQIVLLAFYDDAFRQALDRGLHLRIRHHFLAQLRGADHPFQIDPAYQGLANLGDGLLAIAGYVELFGQDIFQFDVDPRPAFIAVGDECDRQPAKDANDPGHAERDPAAVPNRMQRAADLVEDFLHAPAGP